jgi:hypothetical protein
MQWILLEALVGSRNSLSAFRRNLPIDRGKMGRAVQRVLFFGYSAARELSL